MTRLRNVQRKRRNWRRVKARAVRIFWKIFGVPEPKALGCLAPGTPVDLAGLPVYHCLTPETVADWAKERGHDA